MKYLVYICSENRKTQHSVASKGKQLLLQKSIDFAKKIDEVHRAMLGEGLNYKMADICKMAAAMPAPRFYVDAITALRQYNKYRNGISSIHNDSKRKMYAEIFARYEKQMDLLRSTGQCAPKVDTMDKIVKQEAPSFYYEDGSAVIVYYRIMEKKRRRRL